MTERTTQQSLDSVYAEIKCIYLQIYSESHRLSSDFTICLVSPTAAQVFCSFNTMEAHMSDILSLMC